MKTARHIFALICYVCFFNLPGLSAQDNRQRFPDIEKRDQELPIPPTSFVPQDTEPDKTITIDMKDDSEVYLGNGVVYKGFVIDDKIPGPTFTCEEGEVIEWVVKNSGSRPHGLSIHAAYTQTSEYLGNIAPGEEASVVFRATYPGVYMYHCAPAGHATPMHTLLGQYGMIVVKPKQKYRLEEVLEKDPDLEIYLLQHEFYANGKDAVEGQGKPMYVAFNGQPFRYVRDPIKGRPGDYVRIYFMNAGPNLLSTLHLVGIVWDYAYWQGNPENILTGGQTVTSGPSDTWVVEFRIPPDEGDYTIVTHAFGSASKGAIGILNAQEDADRTTPELADGPVYTENEWEELREDIKRTISPFEPGSKDVDPVKKYPPGTSEITVQIIGNSYYPKVIEVEPGTEVTWINEDVFPFLEGEFSGAHDVFVIDGPEPFRSPMLKHAESYTHTFTEEGEYEYICSPHPYMKGIVKVKERD
ncbi:plastocyanin/azurin family copper-binding protein [Cytophagaceae bacterium ABcell3]|nr:plastocyanin/azurin family copper-binding protein [Cytophagaceae bacterium ABcell3]